MIYQQLLDAIPHISTDDMSYEEWLEKRRESIGGSDAGPIMGLSGKYGSPMTVYFQKKGMEVSKEMSRAAKRGKLLEPLIRDWFAQDYPTAIIERVPYMFRPTGNGLRYDRPEGGKLWRLEIPPFMSANIDGLIYAKDKIVIGDRACIGLGGLEIKSSRDGYDFGVDDIPDPYYAQVQHYMAVLNLDWFIVSVAILSKEEIQGYIIPRNGEFIYELIKAESKFWEDHVVADQWPAALGIEAEEDMITGMFEGGSSLVLGESERLLCKAYLDAHAKFNEMKDEKERIATELKASIIQRQTGKATEKKVSAIAGQFTISWSRFPKHSVDSDALKKDGLYEKYTKIIESGTFRITEKKGA
jgi:predicted phage-related endonuclease